MFYQETEISDQGIFDPVRNEDESEGESSAQSSKFCTESKVRGAKLL